MHACMHPTPRIHTLKTTTNPVSQPSSLFTSVKSNGVFNGRPPVGSCSSNSLFAALSARKAAVRSPFCAAVTVSRKRNVAMRVIGDEGDEGGSVDAVMVGVRSGRKGRERRSGKCICEGRTAAEGGRGVSAGFLSVASVCDWRSCRRGYVLHGWIGSWGRTRVESRYVCMSGARREKHWWFFWCYCFFGLSMLYELKYFHRVKCRAWSWCCCASKGKEKKPSILLLIMIVVLVVVYRV